MVLIVPVPGHCLPFTSLIHTVATLINAILKQLLPNISYFSFYI